MKIYEDENSGEVIIDDFKISGFIAEKNCKACNSSIIYSDRYDAYFCPICNNWLEANCGDPDCDFCKNRPDKPLPVSSRE